MNFRSPGQALLGLISLASAAHAQTHLIQIPGPTPQGVDDTAVVVSLLQSATPTPPGFTDTLIQFKPGVYDLDLNYDWANRIIFDDVDNLRIEGDPAGTTLRFRGFDPTRDHSPPTAGNQRPWFAGFLYLNCDNVSVEGIDMVCDRPMASEGKLVSADPVSGNLVFDIADPDMFLPVGSGPGNGAVFFNETIYPVRSLGTQRERQADPRGLIFAPQVAQQSVVQMGNTQRVTIQISQALGWQISRVAYLQSELQAGSQFDLVVMHQDSTYWATSGHRLFRCSDVEMKDCNISGLAQGVSLEVCDTATFEDVNTFPRKPNWMVGATRSGFGGAYANSGALTFRDCEIIGGFDDGIEVTGHQWEIVRLQFGNLIFVSAPHLSDPTRGLDQNRFAAADLSPGAPVDFYSPDLGSVSFSTTIANSFAHPAGAWLQLASVPAGGLAAGTPVSLTGNVYSSALIEDCFIFGGKGTGIMVAGPNVTIQNNVIRNNSAAAIRGHCVLGGDIPGSTNLLNNTGPAATNLTISNNKITGSNAFDGSSWAWPRIVNWGEAVGAIDIVVTYITDPVNETVFRRSPATAADGIKIVENEINDTDCAGICVASATNVLIENNKFGADIALDYLSSTNIENHLVYIENCDQVSVLGNTATNFAAPFPKSFTAVNTTNLTQAGNVWP